MLSSATDNQITERCAVIVVSRVVLVPDSSPETTVHLSPHMALLVVANAYGRVLVYYVAEERCCQTGRLVNNLARSSKGLERHAELLVGVL